MGITSFYKIGGENNAPGYYDFAFIPHDQILYLPDPINGIINLNNMVLVDGAQFLSGYATINTLNLGDELKQTEHGGICPVDLSGSTPLVNNLNLHLFTQMAAQRFVILARDNNGRWYIGGEPNNGLVFTFKRKASALDFSLTGQYGHICWEVQGNILLDGSIVDTGKIVDCNCPETPGGGGGGEAGGIVYVKRSDGTLISSVTAPADYNVNDSTAKLKDTSGAEISSTPIKAASGVNNITAPDSNITLKDTAGATLDTIAAKSGESKNITAPDGEAQLVNTEAAPIGAVAIKAGEAKGIIVPDTEITVKNSLGLSVENVEVPSCQPNEIVVDDATLVVKNTIDEVIETVGVPAASSGVVVVGNSTVNVRDTADNILSSESVPAENVANIIVENTQISLNSDPWLDELASSIGNIDLVDQDDTPITPILANSTTLKVQVFESDSYIVRRAARIANLIITGNSNSILR